jgi:spermidine synthase
MIPWVHLDTAPVPGSGGAELRLMQRGHELCIFAGPIELMNSRRSGSEIDLAEMTLARIKDRPAPRILIGGLGMGFTLKAALDVLGPKAKVVVVELVPGVIAWAKGPLAEVFGDSLADPRVEIRQGDVGPVIEAEKNAWDAIMLDVDNGPDGLTRPANDRLYRGRALEATNAALKPGGVLSVWSAGPSHTFPGRLRLARFDVEEVQVRANGKRRGARHVIWFATPAARPLK